MRSVIQSRKKTSFIWPEQRGFRTLKKLMNTDPNWLRTLERKIPWLAVPNIAVLLVTLQVIGFLLFLSDPAWMPRLILFPDLVKHGEVWRLLSYLAVPLSTSIIWAIFALWFLYSVLNWIESEWGAFKTTLYVLVSIVITGAFSLIFSYPVYDAVDFNSTLFLASAALFPDLEILLYFILPVKMKYLGYLALAFLAFRVFQGNWMDRLFLVAIYSNYLVFFGPSIVNRFQMWRRRRAYRRNLRN